MQSSYGRLPAKGLMTQIRSEAAAEITVALLKQEDHMPEGGKEREKKKRHVVRKRDNFVDGVRKSNCTQTLVQARGFSWLSLSHSLPIFPVARAEQMLFFCPFPKVGSSDFFSKATSSSRVCLPHGPFIPSHLPYSQVF